MSREGTGTAGAHRSPGEFIAWRGHRCLARPFVAAAMLCCWLSTAASADDVKDYYRNRNVSVIIGYTAGGGYDTYARTLARYMGKYIPGQPTLVPQNMEGAGSLRAANYLYYAAHRDGSVIGTIADGLVTEPLLGDAKYDSTKFTWIGSITNEISLCASWYTSPVKSWNDIFSKSFTFGGAAAGADTDVYALLLRNLFGAKLRLVSGYPGGNDINLAMERGEVEGRCGWSWSSINSRNAEWLKAKKINLLVQFALEKSPELAEIPLIMDMTSSEQQRQVLRLIIVRQVMARPFLGPPGIPEERKRALRQAFDATMKDPDFLAEAAKANLEVNPVSGTAIDALLRQVYATPKDVIEIAKRATQN